MDVQLRKYLARVIVCRYLERCKVSRLYFPRNPRNRTEFCVVLSGGVVVVVVVVDVVVLVALGVVVAVVE